MSGGFLAQALLGGVERSSRGVGDQLREEAKLKRQKALNQQENELAIQRDDHRSDLNREESSQQNEQAKERLKLQDKLNDGNRETWTDVKNEDGKLVGQRSSSGRYAPVTQKPAKFDPKTKYQLDRYSDELDHLWDLETRIRTGTTGDFGEFGVVTNENRDQVLTEIRNRIDQNEQRVNTLLGYGDADPGGFDAAVLKKALTVPEADRGEFLADLKDSGKASDDLVSTIEGFWAKPEKAAQADADKGGSASGGMISHGAGEADQGGKAASGERQVVTEKQPARTKEVPKDEAPTKSGEDMSPQELQAAIVRQSQKDRAEAKSKKAKQAVRDIEQFVISDKYQRMDKNAKAAWLMEYGDYLTNLSPEVLDQVKAIFGDDVVNQHLQQ